MTNKTKLTKAVQEYLFNLKEDPDASHQVGDLTEEERRMIASALGWVKGDWVEEWIVSGFDQHS